MINCQYFLSFKASKDHRDQQDDRDNQDMMEQLDNQDHQVHLVQMDNLERMVNQALLAHKDHLVKLANGVYARNTVLSMVVYSSKMVPDVNECKQFNHFLISYHTALLQLSLLLPWLSLDHKNYFTTLI